MDSKLLPLSTYDSSKASDEVAKANVASAEAALTQARATTVQAEAMLSKAQRNLDFCTIKSPIQGVIIDRRVNIGQTVVSSLNAPSLFLIAKDLTKMQIWVAVNETDVGRIVPGMPVVPVRYISKQGIRRYGRQGQLNATMTQNVVIIHGRGQHGESRPHFAALPDRQCTVRGAKGNQRASGCN